MVDGYYAGLVLRLIAITITIMLMAVAATLVATRFVTMVLAVSRDIGLLIPLVADKIHGLTTGVVLRAVLTPTPFVTRRHMQIQRLAHLAARHPLDQHGSPVDDLWLRIVADIKTPVEAGLAETDGNAKVGRPCWPESGSAYQRRYNNH